VKSKEEGQRQLLEKVIAAQEEERKRIARELHDETGQALTALLMGWPLSRKGCRRAIRICAHPGEHPDPGLTIPRRPPQADVGPATHPPR